MAVADPTFTGRKNHGRGHSYWIDGVKVPGVTTVLGKGFPKPGLINWAAEQTWHYAIDYWDELAALPTSEKIKRLSRARFDTQREASERGTDVHALVHRYIRGEDVTPPEDLELHFQHGCDFVDQWDVAELLVEQPVFHRTFRYAGTPDLIARLADGQTWLLDWKTSAKGVFLDHVLQLAALRKCEFTIDADGNEQPVPQIDATGIVWLRADGAELVPVEAGEAAFRRFAASMVLYGYVEDDRENWIGDTLRPPVTAKGNL